MIIPSGEIIAEEIKRVKIFDISLLEHSAGYLRQCRRQNRHQRGDLSRRHFRRLSQSAPRGRESISGAIFKLVNTLTRASRPTVSRAHESLYVAQGCSSSGSLLCRVPRVPRRHAYTYQIALWSHHVTHNNPVVGVWGSQRTMQFRGIIPQIWYRVYESK